MKQGTLTTAVILAAAIGLAGCSAAQRAPLQRPTDAPPQPSPLEDYRRVLAELKDQQHKNDVLRERLTAAQDEIDQLYIRLSREQKLRREAEVALDAAQAEIEAARTAAKTIADLQAALESTKAELAAAREEIKTRRAELMKLILEQQQWNRYVLDRLRLR